MQRNTGYFPTESLEPCGNRLFSRSALNEGYLFRGSLENTPAALAAGLESEQYTAAFPFDNTVIAAVYGGV